MISKNISMAAMLTNSQQVTHHQHVRGWIETPDGRHFKPDASNVKFIKGHSLPVMANQRGKGRWLFRFIQLFA